MNESDRPAGHLRPTLGLFSALMVVVGAVIGSGIFLKPSQVVVHVGGYMGLILLLWLVCGLVNLCGALTMGELSAMFPHAGGTYVFLREAYGRRVAFLWAWAEFWVIRSGSMAALAAGLTLSVRFLLQDTAWQIDEAWVGPFEKFTAIGTLLLLSGLNILGTWHGGLVQNVTTVIKIGFVAFLGLLPFLATQSIYSKAATVEALFPSVFDLALVLGIARALSDIMWAYDGWGNVTVIAEEIRRPQRNVPLALGGGVLILTMLYLGANWGYHRALPAEVIAESDIPAQVALEQWLGDKGSRLMTSMLLISIFGALNSNVLTGPRVLYAVARDHTKLSWLSRIDPRTNTPAIAIAGLSIWATVLVLLGDLSPVPDKRLFDVLTNYCVFGGSIFYLAAVAAVFVLRWKLPDAPRPYRTSGYPFVPLVFVLFYIALLIGMLVGSPQESLVGLGLVALGAVAFPLLAKQGE